MDLEKGETGIAIVIVTETELEIESVITMTEKEAGGQTEETADLIGHAINETRKVTAINERKKVTAINERRKVTAINERRKVTAINERRKVTDLIQQKIVRVLRDSNLKKKNVLSPLQGHVKNPLKEPLDNLLQIGLVLL